MCRFEYGCVFKLKIQPNEELTEMKFKTIYEDESIKWDVISNNQHKAEPFFITKKEGTFLYVKLENFISSSEVDFNFSLMDDSKGNVHRSVDCCAVQITGMRLAITLVNYIKKIVCTNLTIV